MSQKASRYLTLIVLLAGPWMSLVARAADPDIPTDVLKGIEAMKPLPAEGFEVIQSQGRLLLVSTNGHFVVSGRIFDLWNTIEVHSVADVDRTARIPLAHLGLTAQSLGGVSLGKSEAREAVTVFMDPGSPQSQQLLAPLRELARQRRVDLVFVPAQPARAGLSRAFICHPEMAKSFFESTRLPDPPADTDPCGTGELQRARVTAQLIGVRTLPFSIAPNGATVSGVPKNYAQFISANQE
jgi:thiol:disulfide interchange protein DsbC